MPLPERAQQTVSALDAWAASQRGFFQIIWERFAPEGVWPNASTLSRELFAAGQRINIGELARQMPPQLGRLDMPNGDVLLTFRGMASVEGARPLLEAYVALLRLVVRRYAQPGVEPVVGSAEFEGLLDIAPDRARQLEALAVVEAWALLQSGGSPADRRFALNEHVVFEISEVTTVEEYLDAQARAWWPDSAPVVAAAQTATAVSSALGADVPGPSRPAISVRGLHPLIADEAGRLAAAGHLREGIDRAAVALQEAVRELARLPDLDGDRLMNQAFRSKEPKIVVADLGTESGQNIQRGTHLIAQGIVAAIRNPASHRLVDLNEEEALEQLAILSFIARRLDDARGAPGEWAQRRPADP